MLADGDVVLLLESEGLGVEAERLLLVVHEDAGQVDLHCFGSSRGSIDQRRARSCNGLVSRWWNLYLPSRRERTRPLCSSTSRCCEMAWRDIPSSCFIASRAHSSNSVWPSRSWSSSRIARR